MEYALIVLSTVLFGGQFIALNAYQDKNGKSSKSIFLFLMIFSLIATFVFLCASGFKIVYLNFTLLYAVIAAVLQIILQIAGIKALSKGRVEVYTLFNVAGGMGVTYIFGVTYFQEALKIPHLIGLVLIIVALIVPIIFSKLEKKKGTWIFYLLCVLVFLSNGFFGVTNKIHINSSQGLSIQEYLFYVYLSIFIVSTVAFAISLFKKDEQTKLLFNWKALLFAALYGTLNGVGMFLQYFYADVVPASILFPLSNAGAMVFSFIIGLIAYRKKPTIPDIIQFAIAAIGMGLFFIP